MRPQALPSSPAPVGVRLYELFLFQDSSGALTFGEFENPLPFAVQRYFLVFNVPGQEIRGEHAHRKCHQFLVCAHGSCAVVVNDGRQRLEFLLDRPNLGLHVPPMIWAIQYKFSSDAVLMVLASHAYDPADYIRDYETFLQALRSE